MYSILKLTGSPQSTHYRLASSRELNVSVFDFSLINYFLRISKKKFWNKICSSRNFTEKNVTYKIFVQTTGKPLTINSPNEMWILTPTWRNKWRNVLQRPVQNDICMSDIAWQWYFRGKYLKQICFSSNSPQNIVKTC